MTVLWRGSRGARCYILSLVVSMRDHAPNSRRGGADSYDLFAESASLAPAKRRTDTLKHVAVLGGVTVLAGGAGFVWSGVLGALLGAGVAIVGTGVVLGLALLVMSWLRAVDERIP